MIKAIIFDLDGVLVSTDVMHYKAWKRLADELGISRFNKEDARRQRGVSRMASLEIVLEKADKQYSEEEKLSFAERKNSYYVDMLFKISEQSVLKGVLPFIEKLKENGVLLAVGSASKNAPLILKKSGLSEYLDAVACGLEVTRSKPDPQVFLLAAEKLGVNPENCLVIEDAVAGIEAAKNGGMKALAVGDAENCPLADYSAPDLSDYNSVFNTVFSLDI